MSSLDYADIALTMLFIVGGLMAAYGCALMAARAWRGDRWLLPLVLGGAALAAMVVFLGIIQPWAIQ